MKLLLDQGLPLSAAALLSNSGIETIHVSQIGMSGSEDIEIIQQATTDSRVIVTLDADFHTLLALNNAISPSVIRIRIQKLRALEVTKLLLRVIDECEEDLQQGAAVIVEPNRIRIRRLPILKLKD